MSNVARVATLIAGVLGVVLPSVIHNLPIATQSTVTIVGGALLAVLAYLEHPTTVAKAVTPTTTVITPPPTHPGA